MRFVLYFSFSTAIVPLRNCFSLWEIGLNDHFKYCFLVVIIFTSTLFIGFSLHWSNTILFLNLEFCILILESSFLFLFATLYYVQYSIFTFLVVTLNLNKVLSFKSGICIFFYCLDWEWVLCFPKKKNIILYENTTPYCAFNELVLLYIWD